MSVYSAVIGADLSLTSTGLAQITPDGGIRLGRVKTSGSRDDDLRSRHRRLRRILDKIDEFSTRRWADVLLMVEGPSYGSKGSGTHDRSGLWWIVTAMLIDAGATVVEVSPGQRAKYGTGTGNAAKDAVLAAAVRRYPDVAVGGNDEADALLLAAMGARFAGWPVEASLPKDHLAAMELVRWPPAPVAVQAG